VTENSENSGVQLSQACYHLLHYITLNRSKLQYGYKTFIVIGHINYITLRAYK